MLKCQTVGHDITWELYQPISKNHIPTVQSTYMISISAAVYHKLNFLASVNKLASDVRKKVSTDDQYIHKTFQAPSYPQVIWWVNIFIS